MTTEANDQKELLLEVHKAMKKIFKSKYRFYDVKVEVISYTNTQETAAVQTELNARLI